MGLLVGIESVMNTITSEKTIDRKSSSSECAFCWHGWEALDKCSWRDGFEVPRKVVGLVGFPGACAGFIDDMNGTMCVQNTSGTGKQCV